MRRLLPHPRLTVALALTWLALAQSVGPGHVLLAVGLALAIARFVGPVLPVVPRVRRPARLVAYVGLVAVDIVRANLTVARLTLSPLSRLAPQIVEVPLATRDPFVASLLAATVTLTPGTVSIALDLGAGTLTVHALAAPDADAVVAEIRQRYEARLLEIFEC
ncbi:MAG: Na+/H+ antiporter subunit E [Burkholderiales bacterium]|jgi:multicomponent K+:H+ antiporter subunit E|nr:Na+/H+ antiporter subunit E [Burkholderiales bacterium]